MVYEAYVNQIQTIIRYLHWKKTVKGTLDCLGYTDIWVFFNPINDFPLFQRRIRDHVQEWNEALTNASRLEYYIA